MRVSILIVASVAALSIGTVSLRSVARGEGSPIGVYRDRVCRNTLCAGSSFKVGTDVCETTNNASGYICVAPGIYCEFDSVRFGELHCSGTLRDSGVPCSVFIGKCR